MRVDFPFAIAVSLAFAVGVILILGGPVAFAHFFMQSLDSKATTETMSRLALV